MSHMEVSPNSDPEWLRSLKEDRPVVEVPKELMDQMLESIESGDGVTIEKLRDRLLRKLGNHPPTGE